MLGWVDRFPPLNLWNWPSFYQGDIMHPLVGNLENLTNEELHKKYDELLQKYNQAYRTGPVSVIPQMNMILENYRTELDRRHKKVLEEMEQKSNKFKGIIDIQ